MKTGKFALLAGLLLFVIAIAGYFYTQAEPEIVQNAASPPLNANSLEEGQKQKSFVGAQTCQSCHAGEYEQWLSSDHYKAMQLPNASTVLGDFSDVAVTFHNIQSRFYRQGEKYLIDTHDDQGQAATFEVKHTFGFHPLQQYLIEIQNGHIQAFSVAWDSRTEEQGGQRWFHLQPDENITAEHPFYWTNHFQNWNSRCADCHSTNLQRNYDQASHSFSTTFSEVNVACEACHGAASQHVELAQADKLGEKSGFDIKPSAKLQWQFDAQNDIAQPIGQKTIAQKTIGQKTIGPKTLAQKTIAQKTIAQKNSDELNMCGACHSLRGQLTADIGDGNISSAADFHDQNRLQLVNETTYFADGQSKQEAFVVGSFLQSKMHHKGVTCSNCHNPHTGKVLAEGNGLCAQCHKPQVFDTPAHHHHVDESEGAQCVNCHMPERAFMQVDERRDHSFTIPRPELSLALGVPNACTQCHADKDDGWANQQTSLWNVKSSANHWSHLLHRASQNDILVTRPLVAAIADQNLPDMVRASLLEHFAPLPSRVSAETAQISLQDPSAMVRRAAVVALQGQAAELRWQALAPLMTDSNRSVRLQVAEVLADVFNQLPVDQQSGLSELIGEYRKSLQLSADAVTSQLNLANLEIRLGNNSAAEKAYRHALTIEPNFVPALLSLADFYRRSERQLEEQTLLEKAIAVAPDSGAAQHSIGLSFVRRKDYPKALEHLKLAIEQDDAAPYYAYVYSVALENQGQLNEAIVSLKAADQKWPNQYELLLTLVLYLEKSGEVDSVLPYLSKLSAIAPAAPAVKQLLSKYQAR